MARCCPSHSAILFARGEVGASFWLGKVLPSLFWFWKLRAPTTRRAHSLLSPPASLLTDGQQGGLTPALPLSPDNRIDPEHDRVHASSWVCSLACPASSALLCELLEGETWPCGSPASHTATRGPGWAEGVRLRTPELAWFLISGDSASLLP